MSWHKFMIIIWFVWLDDSVFWAADHCLARASHVKPDFRWSSWWLKILIDRLRRLNNNNTCLPNRTTPLLIDCLREMFDLHTKILLIGWLIDSQEFRFWSDSVDLITNLDSLFEWLTFWEVSTKVKSRENILIPKHKCSDFTFIDWKIKPTSKPFKI